MSLHSCPSETSTGNKASKEAGWLYRVGRITVDQIFSTSRHISPALTFQPILGTGPFVIALADTGWGAAGAWYFTDRVGVIAAVHDADSNRQDFVTPDGNSLYSDRGWRPDRSADRQGGLLEAHPVAYGRDQRRATDQRESGPAGWGYMLKLENELTADGRAIGILRYGRSYDGSALYRQLAGAHWLLYDPQPFWSCSTMTSWE